MTGSVLRQVAPMGQIRYALASSWLSGGCKRDRLKICPSKHSHGAIRHQTDPVPQKARAALVKMADMSSGHYIGESLFTLFASLNVAKYHLGKVKLEQAG